MAHVSRPYNYVSGEVIDPDQVMAVENTLYDEINGQLDETNLSDSTQIPADLLANGISPTQMASNASTETFFRFSTNAGDSGDVSLPTDMKGELLRMRHKLLTHTGVLSTTVAKAASSHTSAASYYTDANAVSQAGWYETNVTGHQLLPNNGFEWKTTGSTSAPDGWTTYGTLTGCSIDTTASTSLGNKRRNLSLTTGGAAGGLEYVLKGLKSSTKYLVGINYVRSSGTINISTSGGLGSGNDYQNLAVTDAATSTIQTAQYIVKTDSSGSDITLRYYLSASSAAKFYAVWVYEMADTKSGPIPSMPSSTSTITSASTYPTTWTASGSWQTDVLTGLSQTVYIPFPGYRLTYDVTVPIRQVSASSLSVVYGAIKLAIDGGTNNVVSGPCLYEGGVSGGKYGDTIRMKYVLDNPTPGSSYALTFLLGNADLGSGYSQIIVAPSVTASSAVQMEARSTLTMERI